MSADPFEPLQSVAALMAAYPRPWFLAGGWAIDLFLGRVRRSHKDVDIALLRRDQLAFQACFATWNLQKLVGPDGQERPEPWLPGEQLELPTFQVWMQRGSDGWPALEALFNESEGDEWRWRVNTQVAYPLAQMGGRSAQGWPYLDPALVLLFKSRHIFPDHRNNANDQQDFNDTAPLLDARQRAWLKVTLQRWYPEHSWIDHL